MYHDQIMIEKSEKKYGNQKILHKTRSNRSFTNGIHSLLKRADARESADIIYLTIYAGQA